MRPSIPPGTVTTLAIHGLCVLAPSATATYRRRFGSHDPVGQVAFCWLIMALTEAAAISRYVVGFPPKSFDIAGVVFGLFPLLLIPPTLTWIGPRAARWRWPLLGAWCAVWAAVFFAGTDRMIMATGFPLMSAGMCALSLWALAVRVPSHTHASDIRTQSWFWILVGHVVYFVANVFRGPLIETLVARHWDVVYHVHNGILLVYAASYLLVARGILQRDDRPDRHDGGAPLPSPHDRAHLAEPLGTTR